MLSLWKSSLKKSQKYRRVVRTSQSPKQELTLQPKDPNGPLIYDMMANRSSGWRDKNMRSTLLPPGWKMGISRLGRTPVYDPLYEPFPPPLQPSNRPGLPWPDVRRQNVVRELVVPPRYQATDPQIDLATDRYNLGLPPHLARLHHDWNGRHGLRGYGGGGFRGGGRPPWIPPSLGGRGAVPVVEDFLDDEFLDEDILDPGLDILERQRLPRRGPVPVAGHPIHHRPGHAHHGHHRPIHRSGHRHRDREILEADLINAELEREVSVDAAEIAALQREMDIQDHRRRDEHIRLQEEHARVHQERARAQEERMKRRDAEEELAVREEQLAVSEAERVRGELERHGVGVGHHHHGRGDLHRHGVRHGHGHAHRRGTRVVRDRGGRPVVVDERPVHRELVPLREQVVHDPHHHEHIAHHNHAHSRHRPTRHVHFAEDLTDEELLERQRQRFRQEAYPLPRRRRFDRDRSPYHYQEDELEYPRDELYDSADEYYYPDERERHDRLLMPPRVVRGDYWEELVDSDDD